MRIVIFLAILFTSCTLTVEQFYQEQSIPKKLEYGFIRNDIFPQYLPKEFIYSEFYRQIDTRMNWNLQNKDFRAKYPFFRVELLAFNHLPNNTFSWEERLLFADALDLIIFVVNHPLFLTEMQKEEFLDNRGQMTVSTETVVAHIRNSTLYFYLGKNTLDEGVVAQATVGGLHNTIWFRNDTDYQDWGLIILAEILLHEITHNLGYLHESNVPHGIQNPFLRVITGLSREDINQFIAHTPYHEDTFLIKVRQQTSFSRLNEKIINN
ncbi:MAG: hypothetical protein ACRC0X_05545 [Brevinema sp.]